MHGIAFPSLIQRRLGGAIEMLESAEEDHAVLKALSSAVENEVSKDQRFKGIQATQIFVWIFRFAWGIFVLPKVLLYVLEASHSPTYRLRTGLKNDWAMPRPSSDC